MHKKRGYGGEHVREHSARDCSVLVQEEAKQESKCNVYDH